MIALIRTVLKLVAVAMHDDSVNVSHSTRQDIALLQEALKRG
jgi:hypothetical protein